jgi:Uma2 family endonuclease
MTIISHEQKQEQERVTPVMPADWVAGPRQGGWTYEMYAALPDDGKRYEVVQGVLMMSPAPESAHQGIIQRISNYLDGRIFVPRLGLVFTSPIDVVLSSRTTVQPDVLVVLKEHVNRVQPKRIHGAPDLAVEVISPSSATYDRLVKYSVYEQAGVPEYWLVNASEQTIEVFVLEEGLYRSLGAFQGDHLLQSRIVPGSAAPAAQFFDWTGGLL